MEPWKQRVYNHIYLRCFGKKKKKEKPSRLQCSAGAYLHKIPTLITMKPIIIRVLWGQSPSEEPSRPLTWAGCDIWAQPSPQETFFLPSSHQTLWLMKTHFVYLCGIMLLLNHLESFILKSALLNCFSRGMIALLPLWNPCFSRFRGWSWLLLNLVLPLGSVSHRRRSGWHFTTLNGAHQPEQSFILQFRIYVRS